MPEAPLVDRDRAPEAPPDAGALPRSLLYATSARIGGTGLDLTAIEALRGSWRQGILGQAIGYANNQTEIPSEKIHSLRFHPVRLLSGLGSERYYGAKKRYADWTSSRAALTGRFDCFHGWSGDCLRTLIAARQRGMATVLDIPTWHRNKGKIKRFETKREAEFRHRQGWRAWLDRLPPSRQRVLLEYALADVITVQSTHSAETFLAAGVPAEKIFYVARGADVTRFTPAEAPPEKFRAIFAGALIRRKGVHHILRAWHALGLRDAELLLVGAVHPEIEPELREFASSTVKVVGFSRDLPALFRTASVFVFPSECEGWAKVTFEAAAAGLPMIGTRESGDGVIDGVTGYLVPANDPGSLAEALKKAHADPDRLAVMGRAARQRVVNHYTWDHYRLRLLHAYALAMKRRAEAA